MRIRNQGDDRAELLLYDEIGEGWLGGIGAREVAEQINQLTVKHLDVRINSPGGSAFEGLAIFNTLRRHPARITVDIDGVAASVASIIAMAGDEIRMADNALMMIHDPFMVTAGDADQLRKDADRLDAVKENLVNIFAGRTGRDTEAIGTMMAAETWFTATEAKEGGFIDSISGANQVAVKLDGARFANIPDFALSRAALEGLNEPPGDTQRAERAARCRARMAEIKAEMDRSAAF